MSEANMESLPESAIDPYKYLQIVLNSDGSLTRLAAMPVSPPSPDPNSPIRVISKDFCINQSKQTYARLYLPRYGSELFPSEKLPFLVYFHGGGFILCSYDLSIFNDFCQNIALELKVAVLSVGYRLSPEHRLPAAFDDAVEALYWIKTCEDEWLTRYVDLPNCYLMGTSAGGTIVYHAGLNTVDHVDDLAPMRIQGLILHQPFFGGVQRSGSERRLFNDKAFLVPAADLMWELSLPAGVDRDHEYCNPMAGGWSRQLEKIGRLGWRVLVIGFDGDPLIDRQIEVVELMKKKGVNQVVGQFFAGGFHGVGIVNPTKARVEELHVVLKNFIFNTSY